MLYWFATIIRRNKRVQPLLHRYLECPKPIFQKNLPHKSRVSSEFPEPNAMVSSRFQGMTNIFPLLNPSNSQTFHSKVFGVKFSLREIGRIVSIEIPVRNFKLRKMLKWLNFRFWQGWCSLKCDNTELKRSTKIIFFCFRTVWLGGKGLHRLFNGTENSVYGNIFRLNT